MSDVDLDALADKARANGRLSLPTVLALIERVRVAEAKVAALLHRHGEGDCRWVGTRNLTTGGGDGHWECPFTDLPAGLTTPTPESEAEIEAKVERSSLGTTEAVAARASVSDEQAARVVARAKELQRLDDRKHVHRSTVDCYIGCPANPTRRVAPNPQHSTTPTPESGTDEGGAL